MRQWEIWTWDFPEIGEHPAVVLSPQAWLASHNYANVLLCSSRRAGRPLRANEVLLNTTDGLDWPTLVRCDMIYAPRISALTRARGAVSRERQRAIVRCIAQCFGWTGLYY